MIVPDKKTNAYLNEEADSASIMRLCRSGVLAPESFLKAVALCRRDACWGRFLTKSLRFLSRLSLAAAIFFFVVAGWGFFYTAEGFIFLCALFVLCAFLSRRSFSADLAGAFLIFMMIFIPDTVFKTDVFLYRQFFLWFLLLLPWAFLSRRPGIRILPFVVFNAAAYLYAVQLLLPMTTVFPASFFPAMALFSLLCLAGAEIYAQKASSVLSPVFRFVPAVFVFLPLLAVPAERCLTGGALCSADFSFLWCLLCSVSFGYVFFFILPDALMQNLLLFFTLLWSGMFLNRLVYGTPVAPALAFPLFAVLLSMLVTGAVLLQGYLETSVGRKSDE